MTTCIVDTNVVSFLLKRDTRAQLYRAQLAGKVLALSFMTVAELYQWAYVRDWGKPRLAALEQHLRSYVIVPYDNELCRHWARICWTRQKIGRPISVQDAWIAATAVRHGYPLVTHNRADFCDIAGLEIVSAA